MPYFAANGVAIGPDYSQASTFPNSGGVFQQAWTKLDCYVNSTDAVCQFLESSSGWNADQAQEILLRMGFNSVPVETPFVAVRFRVWPGTALLANGTVDIRLLS